MNLRCMYCQTMFAISRENMLIGLQAMEADNLSHFDFHCPKCRRANRVERKKLELANPNWKESVKSLAKEAVKAEPAEKPAAPKAKAAAEVKKASSKEKAPAAKVKPAAKAQGTK